jgi:hypothetical protein
MGFLEDLAEMCRLVRARACVHHVRNRGARRSSSSIGGGLAPVTTRADLALAKAMAQALRAQKLLDEGRRVFGKTWTAGRRLYLPRRRKILENPIL